MYLFLALLCSMYFNQQLVVTMTWVGVQGRNTGRGRAVHCTKSTEKLNVTDNFLIDGIDMRNYAGVNMLSCRYYLFDISDQMTHCGHYTAYCKHSYFDSWQR